MRCEKAQPALNALLDGELDRGTAWRVRRHLARCPACAREYREIEALGTAARAWRAVAAPPTLAARVAAALAASPHPAVRAHETAPMRRNLRMQTQRWGIIVMAAALLAVLWSASRRGETALAAVIRATEAAPAVHLVGHGSRGSQIEAWWVDGVGSVMRIKRLRDEQLTVDDLKQSYLYLVREPGAPGSAGSRPDQGRPAAQPERRVDVMPSATANPAEAARNREAFTFTGILKQMARGHAPSEISNTMVVRGGRSLRRITARGESGVFYVDPRSQRVVMMEDWGSTGPLPEYMLVQIDYPDPDSVDRKLFQFHAPPGVPVHHPALMPAPTARQGRTRQEKIWLAEQKEVNTCLSHLSQLREALRRYANDHQGQWPATLVPALDPYIKDRTVLHCPRDHAAGETSYVYHRLSGPAATAALAEMNDSSPREGFSPPAKQEILLDCPHHPGLIWHIDARGSTFGSHRSEGGH